MESSHQHQQELAIAIRREEVARLYLEEKLTMRGIARKLGMSVSTIQGDIQAVKADAIERASETGSEVLAREVAAADRAEKAAWKSYHQSLEDETTTETEHEGEVRAGQLDGQPANVQLVKRKVRKRKQAGGAQYLMAALAAAVHRSKLLRVGGYADAEVRSTAVSAEIVVRWGDEPAPNTPPTQPVPQDQPAPIEAQFTECAPESAAAPAPLPAPAPESQPVVNIIEA